MRNRLVVLGLALAMMSCSKEEVSDVCDETVIDFSIRISETDYKLIHLVEVDANGVTRRYQVTETVWYNLKAEVSQNGFACLTTLN